LNRFSLVAAGEVADGFYSTLGRPGVAERHGGYFRHFNFVPELLSTGFAPGIGAKKGAPWVGLRLQRHGVAAEHFEIWEFPRSATY